MQFWRLCHRKKKQNFDTLGYSRRKLICTPAWRQRKLDRNWSAYVWFFSRRVDFKCISSSIANNSTEISLIVFFKRFCVFFFFIFFQRSIFKNEHVWAGFFSTLGCLELIFFNLGRSRASFFQPRSLARSFSRSPVRVLARSLARSFVRSLAS